MSDQLQGERRKLIARYEANVTSYWQRHEYIWRNWVRRRYEVTSASYLEIGLRRLPWSWCVTLSELRTLGKRDRQSKSQGSKQSQGSNKGGDNPLCQGYSIATDAHERFAICGAILISTTPVLNVAAPQSEILTITWTRLISGVMTQLLDEVVATIAVEEEDAAPCTLIRAFIRAKVHGIDVRHMLHLYEQRLLIRHSHFIHQ